MTSSRTTGELQAIVTAFEEASGSLDITAEPTMKSGQVNNRRGTTLRSLRWTWAQFDHSPIYYTNFWIECWDDGTWKHACHVENRSRHSDWDIWVDLFVKNFESGTVAFILQNQAWFQDLDHGEDWNKDAQGFNRDVYDLYDKLADGTLSPTLSSWKRRDN